MRILLTLFALAALLGCQSKSPSGGTSNVDKQTSFDSQEDLRFIKSIDRTGTIQEVTKGILTDLIFYSQSKGYSRVNAEKLEQALDQLKLECDQAGQCKPQADSRGVTKLPQADSRGVTKPPQAESRGVTKPPQAQGEK